MRYLVLILILFLAVIIQTSLLPFLSMAGVRPNLILVLILIWALIKPAKIVKKFSRVKNIWWPVLLAGLFCDLFSGLPFGVLMLSLLMTFFLLTWLGENVFGQINFGILTTLMLIATLVYNFLLISLTKLFQSGFVINWLNYLIYLIPIEIIANIILIWIIFYGFKKISHQNYFQRDY